MKNTIKILYQFATAKHKTPGGEKEVLKRKIFLNKNINNNSIVEISLPKKGPGSIETEYDNFNKKILSMGLEKKYCSTRAIGMSVLDLAKDKKQTLKKLTAVASKTIKEDNSDVLILGCMSMAFHDITAEIQNKLKIPVINPVKASLLCAENLVKMGISHSKIAYPTPSIKKIY